MANKITFEIIAKALGFKTTDGKVKRLSGSMKRFAAGLVTVATAYKAIGVAIDSVKLAGKLEGVESAFDNMRKQAGFSIDTFSKLDKALNGTADKLTIMEQANSAMLLGIVDSDDQMAEMFDTAQRLAQAVGKDATYGIESLVTGLGRQSKLMLDNLGIMVDVAKANEEYAAELGKTASQLTETERKQAFINKALSEGKRLVEGIGDENLTTAQKMDQFTTSITNFKTEIGEALIESGVIDKLTQYSNALVTMAQNYIQANETASEHFGISKDLSALFDFSIARSQTLSDNYFAISDAIAIYNEMSEESKESTSNVQSALQGLSVEQKEYLTELMGAQSFESAAIKIAKDLDEGKINLLATLRQLNAEMEDQSVITDSIIATSERESAADDAKIAKNRELIASIKANAEAEQNFSDWKKANVGSDLERELAAITEKETAATASIEGLIEGEEEKKEILEYYRELREAAYQEEEDLKRELALESAQIVMDTISTITNAYSKSVTDKEKKQLDELKATKKYDDATKEERIAMEKEISDKFKKEKEKMFLFNKAIALSEVYISTALSITKAGEQLGAFSIPMAAYLGALGLAQAAVIAAQPMPEYQYGGLVGGALHSQGGTVIEAEQGEFVMNRDAVEEIGIENLEELNTGGRSGVTVVVQGNVLTDEFVEEELAEKIADAVRRGTDFGIS